MRLTKGSQVVFTVDGQEIAGTITGVNADIHPDANVSVHLTYSGMSPLVRGGGGVAALYLLLFLVIEVMGAGSFLMSLSFAWAAVYWAWVVCRFAANRP